MRDFVFRNLYLLPAPAQDALVLRYGAAGRGYILDWKDIDSLLGRGQGSAKHQHDLGIKTIARFTVEKEVPLLFEVPHRELAAFKLKARLTATRAIKSGQLIPQPCEKCAAPASESEAHHHDYRHPLRITWLCKKCHGLVHTRKYREALARGLTWEAAPQ